MTQQRNANVKTCDVQLQLRFEIQEVREDTVSGRSREQEHNVFEELWSHRYLSAEQTSEEQTSPNISTKEDVPPEPQDHQILTVKQLDDPLLAGGSKAHKPLPLHISRWEMSQSKYPFFLPPKMCSVISWKC